MFFEQHDRQLSRRVM